MNVVSSLVFGDIYPGILRVNDIISALNSIWPVIANIKWDEISESGCHRHLNIGLIITNEINDRRKYGIANLRGKYQVVKFNCSFDITLAQIFVFIFPYKMQI